MLERIIRENALKNLQINLFGTKIVEMIGTTAVRQTLVTLCYTALFKAKNEPTKMPSKKKKKKKKKTEKATHTESKQR